MSGAGPIWLKYWLWCWILFKVNRKEYFGPPRYNLPVILAFKLLSLDLQMKKLLLLLFKLWSYIVTLGSWENNHGMQLLRRQTKLRPLEESAWALVQRCFSYNVNKLNRRNLNLHCACSNTFWNERMVLIVRGTAPLGRHPKIFVEMCCYAFTYKYT